MREYQKSLTHFSASGSLKVQNSTPSGVHAQRPVARRELPSEWVFLLGGVNRMSRKVAINSRTLAIEYRPVASLRPNPNNPRLHSDKQIQQIATSIKSFGFNVPLLVDASMNLIAGHGRLLACKLLGITQVPTIYIDHLSEQQRRAFVIADNRLTENSEWDRQLLGDQLQILCEAEIDFDVEATGFEMAEIDLMIEDLAPAHEGDADAQAAKAAQEALNNTSSAGNAPGVEKIRELLFGNQMQDYDRRFEVLEQRFQQKMRDMEAESARALQSMESSVKKQLESIASQVRQEQDLRAEADKELGRGLREQIQGLEKHLSKVADQLASLERDFAERLGHESQTLREDIRRRNEDTYAAIERMFSELSNVKTDRNLLAGLFVEIARCLNQDSTPKASGGTRANGPRS
jgi:ParB-like chromosome segregation protein Spo0J